MSRDKWRPDRSEPIWKIWNIWFIEYPKTALGLAFKHEWIMFICHNRHTPLVTGVLLDDNQINVFLLCCFGISCIACTSFKDTDLQDHVDRPSIPSSIPPCIPDQYQCHYVFSQWWSLIWQCALSRKCGRYKCGINWTCRNHWRSRRMKRRSLGCIH